MAPLFIRLIAGFAATLAWAVAQAQPYPSKAIQIIVAYAPGGTGDVLARLVAERLGPVLGQAVVVENRPGASGMIATQQVARSAADGYTLLLGQTGEIAINKSLVKNMPYDAARDLAPIALIGVVPLGLVVPEKSPYASFAALMEGMKAGKSASFASSGTGTPGHLAAEYLKLRARANMTHVPYKGAGPAVTDLLGGHVDMFFSGLPAITGHVKTGRLKLLAVSTAKRSESSPQTPAVAEVGLPGFDFSLWGGLFAPAGTPRAVIERLNREVNTILARPDFKERLAREGVDVTPMSPEQFAAFAVSEIAKYEQIIRETGVKGE